MALTPEEQAYIQEHGGTAYGMSDVAGVLSSGGSGALAGSPFGPIGSLIGGAAGLIGGGYGAIANQKQREAALLQDMEYENKLKQDIDRQMLASNTASADARRSAMADAETLATRSGSIAPEYDVNRVGYEMERARANAIPGVLNAATQSAIGLSREEMMREIDRQNLLNERIGTDQIAAFGKLAGQAAPVVANFARDAEKKRIEGLMNVESQDVAAPESANAAIVGAGLSDFGEPSQQTQLTSDMQNYIGRPLQFDIRSATPNLVPSFLPDSNSVITPPPSDTQIEGILGDTAIPRGTFNDIDAASVDTSGYKTSPASDPRSVLNLPMSASLPGYQTQAERSAGRLNAASTQQQNPEFSNQTAQSVMEQSAGNESYVTSGKQTVDLGKPGQAPNIRAATPVAPAPQWIPTPQETEALVAANGAAKRGMMVSALDAYMIMYPDVKIGSPQWNELTKGLTTTQISQLANYAMEIKSNSTGLSSL